MSFAKTSFLSTRKNYPYKGLRGKNQDCQMEKSDMFPRTMLKKKGIMNAVKEAFMGPLQMSSSDNDKAK